MAFLDFRAVFVGFTGATEEIDRFNGDFLDWAVIRGLADDAAAFAVTA
jgi:hypothetical protein